MVNKLKTLYMSSATVKNKRKKRGKDTVITASGGGNSINRATIVAATSPA